MFQKKVKEVDLAPEESLIPVKKEKKKAKKAVVSDERAEAEVKAEIENKAQMHLDAMAAEEGGGEEGNTDE